MSALVIDHEQGDERLLISKGVPNVLLGHCTRVQVGMDVVPLTDEIRAEALADVDELSGAALRTQAYATCRANCVAASPPWTPGATA